MTDAAQIEHAKSSDLPAITVLLQVVDLPIDGIEPFIDNFLVVRSSLAVAGPEILLGCVGLETYGEYGLLRSLAVHPDRQGLGIGKQLINQIIQIAKEKFVSKIFVLTDTAEELFKNLGFTMISRDKVPEVLLQSLEFTTLCPDTGPMVKEI